MKQLIAITTALISAAPLISHADIFKTDLEDIENKDIMITHGELLVWKASIDDSAIATAEVFKGDGYTVDKKIMEVSGMWDPAFRVGVGYLLGGFDKVDLDFSWTHFNGRSRHISKSTPNTSERYYRQSWDPFLGPIATKVSGQWSLKVDTVDLTVARIYKITTRVYCKPHLGLRGTWVRLKDRANYTGLWTGYDASNTLVELTHNTGFRGKSNFGGAGFRVGSDFICTLKGNFGLYGNFSTSMLYGHFSVRENFNGADITKGPALVSVVEKYQDQMDRVRAIVETVLGVKWWTFFGKNQSKFNVVAGYEISKWFRFNELFQISRSLNTTVYQDNSYSLNANFSQNHLSNDIGFQGVSLTLSFEF